MNKKFSLLLFLFFIFCSAHADLNSTPKIAIIIDDLGNLRSEGLRIVQLPGPVVCSILPYTPFSVMLADAAHATHKEIILHAPMEAVSGQWMGKGGLWLGEDEQSFVATLNNDLQAVPYVQGVNNHMGSLLTQSPQAMDWVMQTIKPRGLFFIDSRTSGHSVAEQVAQEDGVSTATRDVFLDNVRSPEAVREQFNLLLEIARRHGNAIAIGHPYPVTIAFLEQVLPQLNQLGVELVPVSDLLNRSAGDQPVFAKNKSVVFADKIVLVDSNNSDDIEKNLADLENLLARIPQDNVDDADVVPFKNTISKSMKDYFRIL